MKLEFPATVSAAGVAHPDDGAAWRAGVARMRGKAVMITVETVSARRSTQANARYWKAIVPLVAAVLSVDRSVPLSREQAHYVCKMAFLGQDQTDLGPVPRSTRRLDTTQFYEYTERITAWLATEHGVAVPALGESMEVEL